jgi:hypothetical protein
MTSCATINENDSQQDVVVLSDEFEQARPAARHVQHQAEGVAVVADAQGRADQEGERQVDEEQLDQTQVQQPVHSP